MAALTPIESAATAVDLSAAACEKKPYIELAREAFRLSRKGKTHIEIKAALGVRFARDAQHAINIGIRDAAIAEVRLTSDEIQLIRSVANAERSALARGDGCSPKLKWCAVPFWARGKAERIARTRLCAHRKGEDESRRGTGLALLDAYHGGYVRLTVAGWALVHALEAQKASLNTTGAA